jgi:hypothetical protein
MTTATHEMSSDRCTERSEQVLGDLEERDGVCSAVWSESDGEITEGAVDEHSSSDGLHESDVVRVGQRRNVEEVNFRWVTLSALQHQTASRVDGALPECGRSVIECAD